MENEGVLLRLKHQIVSLEQTWNHMYKLLLLFLTVTCVGFCSCPIPEKPSDWDNWSFDEKVTWRGQNLDPRIPYESLTDKVKVKEIMQKYFLTAKTLFVTDNPQSISVKKLPSSYIMKANNASGRGLLVKDGMIFARRKRDSDLSPTPATNKILRSYAKTWLETPFAPLSELDKQYTLIKPMILFEEFLDDLVMDIELFCFYGKVKLIEVLYINAYKNKPVISFYDPVWKLIEVTHPKYEVKREMIDKPDWLEELIAVTEQLTKNIDQVRVDFYLTGKGIYFGEFTFTTGRHVIPESLQKIMGSYWEYPVEGKIKDAEAFPIETCSLAQ